MRYAFSAVLALLFFPLPANAQFERLNQLVWELEKNAQADVPLTPKQVLETKDQAAIKSRLIDPLSWELQKLMIRLETMDQARMRLEDQETALRSEYEKIDNRLVSKGVTQIDDLRNMQLQLSKLDEQKHNLNAEMQALEQELKKREELAKTSVQRASREEAMEYQGAIVDKLQEELERIKAAVARGGAAQDQLRDAELRMLDARQKLALSRSELDSARVDSSQAILAELDSRAVQLNATTARLEYLRSQADLSELTELARRKTLLERGLERIEGQFASLVLKQDEARLEIEYLRAILNEYQAAFEQAGKDVPKP